MNTAVLKEIAEKIVPRKYLRVGGLYFLRAQHFRFKGNQVQCTCCKTKLKRFQPYGKVNYREYALCTWCLSLERHRLLWLYFERKTELYTKELSVLHFAPEHQFQEKLKAQPNINYLSCDLDMPTAMDKQDITQLTYEDNRFDVIICNHVLEHIPDDKLAMSELFRVLKPGGYAILQTPMKKGKTIEDITLNDPKEQERLFGQNDHVRVYGDDKKDRLEAVGFEVVIDEFVRKDFTVEEQKYYGLMLNEDVWIANKPL